MRMCLQLLYNMCECANFTHYPGDIYAVVQNILKTDFDSNWFNRALSACTLTACNLQFFLLIERIFTAQKAINRFYLKVPVEMDKRYKRISSPLALESLTGVLIQINHLVMTHNCVGKPFEAHPQCVSD